MNLLQKINFRETKYMLPAILYLPILGTGWLFIDAFQTEVNAKPAVQLEETEYLNASLPAANIKDDGIGNRTESMIKSFGRIQDYTAVENIEQTNETPTEDYNSRYSAEEFAMLDKEAEARTEELLMLSQMQEQNSDAVQDTRLQPSTPDNAAVLADLERALAEARLKGQRSIESAATSVAESVSKVVDFQSDTPRPADPTADKHSVTAIDPEAQAVSVVKVRRPSSSYFNTIGDNSPDPRLIKAIIDQEVKAVDGSRVRLRLLDDIEVNDIVLPTGTYLYATVSGFGSQRIKGSIKSMLINDELVKINLSIYDTDGMEGLYVPNSDFRETVKDMAGATMDNQMTLNENSSGMNNFAQWGMTTLQNAYQKASSAIGKSIRKNRAKIKYGTVVYLINGNNQ